MLAVINRIKSIRLLKFLINKQMCALEQNKNVESDIRLLFGKKKKALH